jgi:hypothetical protein
MEEIAYLKNKIAGRPENSPAATRVGYFIARIKNEIKHFLRQKCRSLRSAALLFVCIPQPALN